MSQKIRLFVLLIVSGTQTTLLSNEWSQFRGPDGQGHAFDAKNLPTTWSETENIVWKAEIPGRGSSSPVFNGGKIWLTTALENPLDADAQEKVRSEKLANNPLAKQMSIIGSVTLLAIGIDPKTGRVESQLELFTKENPDPIHSLNTYAAPTPILDGSLLYCHFGELGTACVDTETDKIVWIAHLPSHHSVGAGSSPVIFEDLFIVPCDGTDQQYVVGLRKLTGKMAWKKNRMPMTGEDGEMHKAFCTPLLVKVGIREQLIIPGAQRVISYDPRDGYEIWSVRYGEGFSNVPRPVAGHGMVYICTGFMSPQIWAITLEGRGDVTETNVKFKFTKQVPTMSSPVLVDDQLYFVSDQGVVTSINALTGVQIWTKRIAGNFCSSPLYADGRIYFCSQEGKTTVIRPGRKYDEVAVNFLDGALMASPAVYKNTLLLRSPSHVYRIAAPSSK